jgi:hypothetical protein
VTFFFQVPRYPASIHLLCPKFEKHIRAKLTEYVISLLELGEKLTTEGAHKIEGTPRRVRGLLGGQYIFDTLESKYVWEHPDC